MDAGRRVTAVSVSSTSSRVDIGAPTVLFELDPRLGLGYPYDVSADGKRFVVLRNPRVGESEIRMIVTVDWLNAIKAPGAAPE